MSQCVLLDSTDDPDVAGALRRAQTLLARPLRRRPRLAALDAVARAHRDALRPARAGARGCAQISALRIRNAPESGAAALLLCGWLRSRLRLAAGAARRATAGAARSARWATVEVRLESVRLDVPGLMGVTLRLPRRRRALARPRRRRPARDAAATPRGGERSWTLLGASRGEGGILGEGMRQSLLRDPTYREALDAAGGDADVSGSS